MRERGRHSPAMRACVGQKNGPGLPQFAGKRPTPVLCRGGDNSFCEPSAITSTDIMAMEEGGREATMAEAAEATLGLSGGRARGLAFSEANAAAAGEEWAACRPAVV